MTVIEWVGPREDEIDNCNQLRHVVPAERWPYGPPSFHERGCMLHAGGLFCDCRASEADDDSYGVGGWPTKLQHPDDTRDESSQSEGVASLVEMDDATARAVPTDTTTETPAAAVVSTFEPPTDVATLLAWARTLPCPAGRPPNKRHNHSQCQAGETIIKLLGQTVVDESKRPYPVVENTRIAIPVHGEEIIASIDGARRWAASILQAADEAEAAATAAAKAARTAKVKGR